MKCLKQKIKRSKKKPSLKRDGILIIGVNKFSDYATATDFFLFKTYQAPKKTVLKIRVATTL